MPPHPQMHCFVCDKLLNNAFRDDAVFEAHPDQAVCFRGSAPYGSRFDSDHQEIGLSGYEIFVCDDCWEKYRTRALGWRTPLPVTKPLLVYISGETIVKRFKELEDSLEKLHEVRDSFRDDLARSPEEP